MASRPRPTGAPARLHAAPREGMAGSFGCPARPTETEADHHNRTADDAGKESLRRPRENAPAQGLTAPPRSGMALPHECE